MLLKGPGWWRNEKLLVPTYIIFRSQDKPTPAKQSQNPEGLTSVNFKESTDAICLAIWIIFFTFLMFKMNSIF